MSLRRALHAYGLALAVVFLLLSPLLHGKDDFPLSTYPMFSRKRPEVAWIARASAVDKEERQVLLSPSLIASSEPMQAVATLNRALSRPSTARVLCKEIAGRVARSTSSSLAPLQEVRLDLLKVSVLGWFQTEQKPLEVRPKAHCPILRDSPSP